MLTIGIGLGSQRGFQSLHYLLEQPLVRIGGVDRLAEAAEEFVAKADFPPLYDPAVLAENTVPTAAALFYDDMFVPFEYSVRTAQAIGGLRPVITNTYQHDGIRVDGAHLVNSLINQLRRCGAATC